MDKPILLSYRRDNGEISNITFVPNQGEGTKLFKDDVEITNFTIIDESFNPILTMIEKSNQDLYADSYVPINITQHANMYTKSGDEEIPLGTFSSDYIPSVDNIILIFNNVGNNNGVGQPMTYSKHKRLGTIVTVDAR